MCNTRLLNQSVSQIVETCAPHCTVWIESKWIGGHQMAATPSLSLIACVLHYREGEKERSIQPPKRYWKIHWLEKPFKP